VDAGLNPDAVTQELLEAAHKKSEATRGKLFSTKVYAEQLSARRQ
jgi:hypothetical protein